MSLTRWLCFSLFIFIHSVTSVQLAPISHPHHVEDAARYIKRQESFTGELELQDFETFYWGAPAGTNLIYANLTVYFPEQYERVIAMERFADQLKSVNCAEDMMLEFKDDASFEYAKDVWNWVNDDVNRTFIMVTNYAGCADDMERLPFVVSNIRYDEVANKAFLKADLKEWADVAHSYTLNIGHTPLTPAHRMLMSRGILPRDTDFSMSLVSGFDQNLFEATVGDWTTSVDAVVRTVGSLDVDFDIDVGLLQVKSASMTISPENVAASIQLALSEKGKLGKAYTWQDTVISIPINGIEILKVVKLGAFLDIDVGFTMSEWEGTASASLGARMELSNAAIVKIDLVNSKNNQFSGWTPKFSPIPLTVNAKVDGSARVYAEPNVKIEASVLRKGWNVGLNLQMPYIEADFSAMLDTSGVCGTKKTIGVDVDARVGVELSVQAASKGNEANPFWSQELFSSEWDLFSKCMAFGPDNAKPGQGVDPKPPKSKSKKPHSKPPKASKTPKPKPRSSKPAVTLQPKKPTPKPSKKPASTRAKPSNAVSSKTAKPTDSDRVSSKIPSKSAPNDSERPSKTPIPSSRGGASTAAPKPSSRSDKDESDSRSNTKSRSNSISKSHSSSISQHSSSKPLSTSSMPFRNTSVPITKPPSTLATATLSTSFSPSASSSAISSCSINDKSCRECQLDELDSLNQAYYSDMYDDPDSPSTNLTFRRSKLSPRDPVPAYQVRKPYEIQCGASQEMKFRLVAYPKKAHVGVPGMTVTQFYKAKETNCLNHDITSVTASRLADVPEAYQMEHVYQGGWIKMFLEHLRLDLGVACGDIYSIFFTERVRGDEKSRWVDALMGSLGSRYRLDDLVFLDAVINSRKNNIFEGSNIIDARKFNAGDAQKKVEMMRVVGLAMSYMADEDVGDILLKTARQVEGTLHGVTAALPSLLDPAALQRLGRLKDPGALANEHRAWLVDMLRDREDFARKQMNNWAGLASDRYLSESPSSAVATMNPTKRSDWTSTTSRLDELHKKSKLWDLQWLSTAGPAAAAPAPTPARSTP